MNAPTPRNNKNGTEFRLLSRLNRPDPGGDGRSAVANLLAWGVPLTVLLAGLLFLHGDGAARILPGKKAGKRPASTTTAQKNAAARPDTHLKQLQAKRPLPPDYSEKLVAQSEVLARKNLLTQLQSFREMSRRMKDSRDALLSRIEARPLLPTGPFDANDTSAARALPSVSDPGALPENVSMETLYGLLREYEAEIQRNHLAESAARRALSRGLSFPEVYRSMQSGSTQMPTFDELIEMQSPDGTWARTGESAAAAGLSVRSTAELNRYRELLGQAVRQAGLAGSRLAGLFDGGRPLPQGLMSGGNGSGGGGSGGGSGMGGSGEAPESIPMTAWSEYAGERLAKDMVKAQALPGRRFTREAENRGWLYINTWYMIGPWENYGRDDYAQVHPPELSIDLDAVYTDGQRGEGVEETDSDPIKVSGKKVRLDGVLRWKFMQSESMHNTVPVTTDHSTYYAYTELYFDRAVTMLVAIGTDDGGRLWINGRDVWQDAGTSWYNIDEHIEPFEFRQGWNTVLVRLENSGGSATGFSFMIIPADQVPQPKPDAK